MPEIPLPPKGTRFPNLPPLPKLPDPAAPLKTVLDGIRQFQAQGDAAISAGDELAKTVKGGVASLAESAKARLKSSPFPKKGP